MGPRLKLIVVVVQDRDVRPLTETLNRARIGVTRLASTGGFLLEGNTTLLIGVEEERVEEVLQAVRSTCMRRTRLMIPEPVADIPAGAALPVEVETGGAVVWVLSVERVERF